MMNVFPTFEHSLIIKFDSVLEFIIISKIHRKYFSDTDWCSLFNEGKILPYIGLKIKFMYIIHFLKINVCISNNKIF